MSIRTLPQPTAGGDFTPPPAGNHGARCYRVVDLGTQQTEFNGETKRQHKVLVSWELDTDQAMEDGRRFTIHQRYTFSTHEKAKFRQDLESWRGRPFTPEDFGTFDIRKLLGVACMINVVHKRADNGKTYANVAGVTPVPRGLTVPELENETAFLSLDPEDFNAEVFNALSDGLKETIKKSPEYGILAVRFPKDGAEHAADDDWQAPQDDVPPPASANDYGAGEEPPF